MLVKCLPLTALFLFLVVCSCAGALKAMKNRRQISLYVHTCATNKAEFDSDQRVDKNI